MLKPSLKFMVKRVLLRLPKPFGRMVVCFDYAVANRARTAKALSFFPTKGLRRGAAVISLDFEMAWGWQYTCDSSVNKVQKGLQEREKMPQILNELNSFGIVATWATVGHLFLRQCRRGKNGLAHPDMPRPDHFENKLWRFSSGDWYQYDPCSDLVQDPAWYAPDLIEKILSSSIKHEIACHGFSHAGFGDYCAREVAKAELEMCREVMAPFGLKPTTFVFPGNDEGNFSVLREKGVRIVRISGWALANIGLPKKCKDGLWLVPVSTAINRGQRWTADQRLARLKACVDAAVETKLASHIWLHPCLPDMEIKNVFSPFLRYVAEKREKGLIDVYTMEQLVQATEGCINSGDFC